MSAFFVNNSNYRQVGNYSENHNLSAYDFEKAIAVFFF